MKTTIIAFALAASAAAHAGPQQPAKPAPTTPAPTTPAPAPAAAKDIVDTAASDPQFSTLVTAVKAAGLVDTLKGKGPFTVFAPTNEAFAKLPKDKLDALLADKAKLTAVLTYHVVPGKLTAADVGKKPSLKTVQGKALKVEAGKEGAKVGGAKVIATDVTTSNGVIHVIDTVLVP